MVFFGECTEARRLSQKPSDMEIKFRVPSRTIPDLHTKYAEIISQLGLVIPAIDANTSNRIRVVMNELVVNAMKYRSEQTIVYAKVSVYGDHLVIEVSNRVAPPVKHVFIRYLMTLFASDLDKVYIKQIEHLVEDPDSYSSKIGLITVLRDCKVDLGYMVNDEVRGTRIVALAYVSLKRKCHA